MEFIDTLHIIIIPVVKVKVVAFGLAHFQVLFYLFFLLGSMYFLSPLIFLLGLLPSFFIFYFLFFFKIWENNLQKARYVHILQEYHNSIPNYESYTYRTLTAASHGDGIS